MTYRNMGVNVDGWDALLGTRVSVDMSTKNQINRQLAANIDADEQLRFNGDVDCKISVDFLARSYDNGYDGLKFLFDSYHGTGANSMVLTIGGNVYSGCYIDSFSLSVKPFEPVMGNVSFTSFIPDTGNISGVVDDTINDELSTSDIIYGHTCSLRNADDVVSANIIDNLTYSKTYSRTPVYTLGSSQATSQLIDAVEVDVNVQSTGLNSLISISGSKLGQTFGVILDDVAGSGINYDSADLDLIVNSGAHVVAEGYSVDGGGTLVTKATIKEVIL